MPYFPIFCLDIGRKGIEKLPLDVHLSLASDAWAENPTELLFDRLNSVLIEARGAIGTLMIAIDKKKIMIFNDVNLTYLTMI
jgi:hypothetical protein